MRINKVGCLLLGCSIFLSQFMFSMDQKAESLIRSIGEGLQSMETTDVVSPQVLEDFNRSVKNFDQIANQLKPETVNRAKIVVKKYEHAYKKVINNVMMGSFLKNKTQILNAVSGISIAMMVGALGSVAHQGARMGTGNLATMDYSEMAQAAFTGATAEGLRILSGTQMGKGPQNILIGGGSNAITQIISGRSSSNQPITLRFESPSLGGVIGAVLKKEAMDVALKICNDMGGPLGIASQVQWRRLLVDQKPVHNEMVRAGMPIIKKALGSNNKLSATIAEIGLIACESALVGGLLSLAGLGYPGEQNMLVAMGNSMLRGAVAGTYAYASVRLVGWKPTPLAVSLLPLPGLSPIGIVSLATTPEVRSAFAHAMVQTVVEYAVDSGGLMGKAKEIAGMFTMSVQDHWRSTWESTQSLWSFMGSLGQMPTE